VIRRGFASTLAVLAFAVFCAATDLPNQWRAWHYSRAVTFSAGQRSPFTLKLPFDLLARSDAHSSDIRVIDDHGQEVPYALNLLHAISETRVLPSRLLERSFVAGQFTQIIVGVNDKPALDKSHGVTPGQLQAEPWFNTYRVITPESDFMFWVETSVSDDAHQWRVVDARSPISRFRKHALEGNQAIQFEGYSNQRFLRLRVFDLDRQFAVDSVQVLSRQSTEPPRIIVPATFSPKPAPELAESRLCTDLTSRNFPVSELDFSTNQPEFYRAVRISGSVDGQEWSYWGSGVVYRYAQGKQTRELLRIDFPEAKGNKLVRVEVINGNDEPLANLHLALKAIPRALSFREVAGQQYRLIYGNEKASRPQYDLGHYFESGPPKPVYRILTLGPEEETANYRDPRPFTERHPELLWSALGAAILLIGLTAIKALRSTGKPTPQT